MIFGATPNTEFTEMIRLTVKAILIAVAIELIGGCPIALAHEGQALNTKDGGESHAHPDDSETGPANELRRIPLTGPKVQAFEPFAKTVSARVVGQHLVLESNGLPDHQMMVGIQSWQQQVPLPQPFTGQNAWRLRLNPQFAKTPISVLEEPLRGAIALAVNGVPMFCALNNRGDDTYLAGELDKWGGHCGRGDDYHYHVAPVHLEAFVGVGNPIGYALDGYPILGLTEADGSVPNDLDKFNGHKDSDGNYHYHATQTFPYINGGLRGVVTMDGDQIQQPRDSPVRPGQSPLRGATVTGYSRNGDHFDLEYKIAGRQGHVKYSLLANDQVEFSYVTPSGDSSKAIHRRAKGGKGQFVGRYGIVILLLAGFLAAALFVWKYRRAQESA